MKRHSARPAESRNRRQAKGKDAALHPALFQKRQQSQRAGRPAPYTYHRQHRRADTTAQTKPRSFHSQHTRQQGASATPRPTTHGAQKADHTTHPHTHVRSPTASRPKTANHHSATVLPLPYCHKRPARPNWRPRPVAYFRATGKAALKQAQKRQRAAEAIAQILDELTADSEQGFIPTRPNAARRRPPRGRRTP